MGTGAVFLPARGTLGPGQESMTLSASPLSALPTARCSNRKVAEVCHDKVAPKLSVLCMGTVCSRHISYVLSSVVLDTGGFQKLFDSNCNITISTLKPKLSSAILFQLCCVASSGMIRGSYLY